MPPVVSSFLLSCSPSSSWCGLPEGQRVLVDRLYTWIGAGVGDQRFTAEIGFRSIRSPPVMMPGGHRRRAALIHIYSIGYMDDDHRDDRGFQRFFCYLNLFTFSMLDPGAGRQPGADVPGLGGGGPLLLSVDRLLVQRSLERLLRQQGVHRQSHRRLRLPGRHLPALLERWPSVGSPTVAFADIAGAFGQIAS